MRHHSSIKRLLSLLLLATLSIAVAQAQYRYTFRDSLGVYKVEFTPYKSDKSDAQRMHIPVSAGAHEIRLGSAYASYISMGHYTTDSNWHPAYDFAHMESEQYSSSNPHWYTVGFEGGRWFKEWLYFGGTAVWTGGFSTLYKAYPLRGRVYTYTSHNISVMPTVRFAWLRRGIVQLYSGVGLGLTIAHTEEVSTQRTNLDVAYDVTFIGISVGRDFFGYFDLGAGSRGVLSVGVGYRFNNHKGY